MNLYRCFTGAHCWIVGKPVSWTLDADRPRKTGSRYNDTLNGSRKPKGSMTMSRKLIKSPQYISFAPPAIHQQFVLISHKSDQFLFVRSQPSCRKISETGAAENTEVEYVFNVQLRSSETLIPISCRRVMLLPYVLLSPIHITHSRRRHDETVLSRRRRRCEHNSQLAHDDCRRIRSTIWKLAKQTP